MHTNKQPRRHHPHDQFGLRLIASFKLFEGLLLLAAGIGLLNLLHRDVGEVLMNLFEELRVRPANRFATELVDIVSTLDDAKLKKLSAATFLVAAFHLTEAIGLLLKKAWAEYLTVVSTGVFVPFEVLEVIRHATPTRIGLLLINVAVVAYLVYHLRKRRRTALAQEVAAVI